MSKYRLTREEQETSIRTNAAAREWDFFTLDKKYMRQLQKLGYQLKKDHQGGWSCRVPLNSIRIRRNGAPKRKASPESIAALARARASSKSPDNNQGNSDQIPPATV
jgi:hypothetical protein